jgi:7-cyano-7-deazaguanine synthase
LTEVCGERLGKLVEFDQPVADLYGQHWSITGENAPGPRTADDAVFLHGRNALLLLKAALWCQMRGIGTLALGTLDANPFPDARPEFFRHLEQAVNLSGTRSVRFVTPLSKSSKADVMRLGSRYPLHLTFSCLSPFEGLHCGACNKCAERKRAFRDAGQVDQTTYAARMACPS